MLIFMRTELFAQTPDTLTPETKARWKIGRIRENTIKPPTPVEFRNAFNELVNLAVTNTPVRSIAELRAGKADTAQVVQVLNNQRVWTYRYDPASEAPDDSAIVIKSGNRRYVIVADVITPQMFGVTANGVYDESTLVKKAILKAAKMKKPIYFPEGIYRVSLDFANLDGLTISGAGSGSVLKLPNGINKSLLKLRLCSNVTIQDISFDGNKAYNPTRESSNRGEVNANDNIYVSRGSNIKVIRTNHVNSLGGGINGYRILNFHFDYNTLKDCNSLDQNAITVQFGHTSARAEDNSGSISFNYIEGNARGMGMSAFQAFETTIQGNIIKNCFVGIGLEWGGSKNRVSDNLTLNCEKPLVITSKGDSILGNYNTVSNNQFLECAGTSFGAVQIAGQTYLNFTGNTLTGKQTNNFSGIYAYFVRESKFDNNVVHNFGGNGMILIVGTNVSSRVIASRNAISANKQGGLVAMSVDDLEVRDNSIYNNVLSGIKLQACSRSRLTGNRVFDSQKTATQQYAIILQDCNYVNESENEFFSNLFLPDVHLVGKNANHYIGRRINVNNNYRTAVPTTATWAVGDVVYNSAPAYGKPLSWRCIAAGSPGTWVINQIAGNTSLHVTAAEKAAMSPADGERVFQTDSVKGEYVFVSGKGWVPL